MNEERLSINKNFCYTGGKMKKMFSLLGLAFIFFIFVGYSDLESFSKNSIKELDNQIESLEIMRKQYQKNIKEHLNLAHRWQKNEDLALESRREYALAEHQKDKMHIVEKKIERLKKEKMSKESQEK